MLLSAVLKLMRSVRLAPGLRLYRGLGGQAALPDGFRAADADGIYGYTEWGFMSTTSNKDVAIQARRGCWSGSARARAGAVRDARGTLFGTLICACSF